MEIEDDVNTRRGDYANAESRGEAKRADMGDLFYIRAFATAGVILARGETLATILAGAVTAGSGGALIGVVLGEFIDERRAKHLQHQLDHGSLLLRVRTKEDGREKAVEEILAGLFWRDVHAHALGT